MAGYSEIISSSGGAGGGSAGGNIAHTEEKVHLGEYFNAGRHFTPTADQWFGFYITTGSANLHTTFRISSTSTATEVHLYEDVTLTPDGTVSVFNANRNFPDVTQATVEYINPTSTNPVASISPVPEAITETIIPGGTTGGGNASGGIGGDYPRAPEIILRPNTTYFLSVFSFSGSSVIGIELGFYENS